MNWRLLLKLYLIFAGLFLAGCDRGEKAVSEPTLVITGVNVVDVEAGEVLRDRTLIVTGNRITDVISAKGNSPPPNARLIDGRGKYAIPGLWDMHVHLFNTTPPVPWELQTPLDGAEDQRQLLMPLYVAFGITGLREMSGGPWSLKLRDQVSKGEVLGPQLVVGSPLLDGANPLFPDSNVIAIDGPKKAREVVRTLHRQGYDFLKTYTFLSPESYRAIHERAKTLGMEVSGEIPISISLKEAAGLGHRTVEHLTGLELACSRREQELRAAYAADIAAIATNPAADNKVSLWNRTEWEPVSSVDNAKCARLYDILAKKGTWVVPTLAIQRMISQPESPAVHDNPDAKYVPIWDSDPADVIATFDPERHLPVTFAHRLSVIDDLQNAGVGILAGTDIGAGFTLHQELELFVEGGLSPAEALRTATINPAKYLEREEELGTIVAGKFADIVLLNKNPLADISNTRSIDAVILQGRYYDRTRLDTILQQVETDARSWEAEENESSDAS